VASADSIEITVSTDAPTYGIGAPIDVAISLVNRAAHPASLRFSDGQRYDFLILDAGGDVIWRWSAEKFFIQMLGEEQLAPGETRSFRERFEGRLEPGTYAVVGRLVALARPLEARTTFTVR
jgi:hypothetical protein